MCGFKVANLGLQLIWESGICGLCVSLTNGVISSTLTTISPSLTLHPTFTRTPPYHHSHSTPPSLTLHPTITQHSTPPSLTLHPTITHTPPHHHSTLHPAITHTPPPTLWCTQDTKPLGTVTLSGNKLLRHGDDGKQPGCFKFEIVGEYACTYKLYFTTVRIECTCSGLALKLAM